MNEATSSKLAGPEQTLAAMVEQMHSTRRYFQLYAPSVDPVLFNQSEWLAAIRARVTDQPRMRLQFILPPARDWRRDCAQFLSLNERLRSAMELRCLPTEEPRERALFQRLFAVGDRASVLELADLGRAVGTYQARQQGRARQLLTFFNEIWEKAGPDPELRQLTI